MATYNEESRAPATGIAGTVLGSIGTALGLGLFNGNGLNLFGGSSNQQVAEMQNKIQELSVSNAIMSANAETDRKLVEVFKASAAMDKELTSKIDNLSGRVLSIETAAPIKEQLVDQKIARATDTMSCCCNATNAAIANLQNTLSSITKIVVPNSNVCPGWGNVTITPTPDTSAAF